MCLRVNSCCCCCISLEAGTKGIAIFGILVGLFMLLFNVASMQPWFIVSGVIEIIVCMLLSSTLLYGVQKRKPVYLMAWLVVAMIYIIMTSFCATALLILTCLVDSNWEEVRKSFRVKLDEELEDMIREYIKLALLVTGAMLLLMTVLNIYFWIVVHSFYQKVHSATVNNHPSYGRIELIEEGEGFDMEKGFNSKN